VIGIGSASRGLKQRLVYAMRVQQALTFQEYWDSPEYRCKKPVLNGSLKQLYGDNIYQRASPDSRWRQENSHHSLRNGEPNPLNIANDTKVDRVLISHDFAYWGARAIAVPANVRRLGEYDVCRNGRGTQCNFPTELADRFVAWFRGLGASGYLGDPLEFSRHRSARA
jgi:hypothetical protein